MGIKFQIIGTGIALTFLLMSCGFQGPDSHETTWEPELSTTANQSLASESERPVTFLRGDVNGDASIDISDAIGTLAYLFAGNTVPCEKSVDSNDDGIINVADAIQLLGYVFGGTSEIPAPFPTCDTDSTVDALSCESYGGCL